MLKELVRAELRETARTGVLQGIAYATSTGDFKTAYSLLASISPKEALEIIEKGIKDHLGVSMYVDDDAPSEPTDLPSAARIRDL